MEGSPATGTSGPTSLQSIHFPRSDRSCQLERAELVLPEALCLGEFDTPGDLCVAVGSVEGLLSIFKVSVGARVWTEVNGLGCIASLLAVRGACAGGRDLVLATTAGERFMSLLDCRGGAVWRARVENVLEACCSDGRGCGEGRAEVALGAATGAVALYDLSFDPAKASSATRCVCSQSWKLSDEGTLDAVSFARDRLVASMTGGAVYLLGPGAAVECVTRSVPNAVPSRTKCLKQGVLVTVGMDGSVRLRNEASQSLYQFSLENSVISSFKTSNLLRIGDENAAAACSWNGDTWFVDGLGNVLLFQPLDDQQQAAVTAFDVFKSKHTGEASIVYLLSTGQIIFFAVDLTCLECRLFSHHAHSFVQQHPFFATLNAKQRALLIDLAMKHSYA